ncbi:MAG: hypothetical protein ACTS4T_01330 [Candidatus Hodgkinia cicadicola]
MIRRNELPNEVINFNYVWKNWMDPSGINLNNGNDWWSFALSLSEQLFEGIKAKGN